MSDRTVIDRFLSDASLSAATRRAYRSDVAEFNSWLHAGGLKLDDVETSTLAAYAATLAAARPGR
ncbi:MAG TPA: site-specific integrase, partial [Actinomycetota bacterium]|nr:site-specific integrase [Actinomycetota bacterium]